MWGWVTFGRCGKAEHECGVQIFPLRGYFMWEWMPSWTPHLLEVISLFTSDQVGTMLMWFYHAVSCHFGRDILHSFSQLRWLETLPLVVFFHYFLQCRTTIYYHIKSLFMNCRNCGDFPEWSCGELSPLFEHKPTVAVLVVCETELHTSMGDLPSGSHTTIYMLSHTDEHKCMSCFAPGSMYSYVLPPIGRGRLALPYLG